MRARIKADCTKQQVFAARGLLFVRDTWTVFPEIYAAEIGNHPYLEIEQEQPAEMVIPPAYTTDNHEMRRGRKGKQ